MQWFLLQKRNANNDYSRAPVFFGTCSYLWMQNMFLKHLSFDTLFNNLRLEFIDNYFILEPLFLTMLLLNMEWLFYCYIVISLDGWIKEDYGT